MVSAEDELISSAEAYCSSRAKSRDLSHEAEWVSVSDRQGEARQFFAVAPLGIVASCLFCGGKKNEAALLGWVMKGPCLMTTLTGRRASGQRASPRH